MATLPPYAANTISLVSTTHSKLLHVSVYTGRAELQRLFKFNVKTGQNQLQITGLPIVIQAESLRVQGHGNATIHDVSISSMPPKIPTKPTSPLIQDLQTKKKAVQNAISRHKTSSRALDNYIRSMTVHDVPFSQVEALMGTYDSQASKIEEGLVKLRKEEDALDEEIAVEHARIVKDQGEADGGSGAYLGMQVSIGLFAENEGEIELELVYAVTHANWYALYDLRVNLEAKDNPLTLVYKAAIAQNTGEDWTNIPLTLETATPSYGVQIPTLNPLKLTTSPPAPSRVYDYSPYPQAIIPAAAHMMPAYRPAPRPPSSRSRSRSPSMRRRSRRREHESFAQPVIIVPPAPALAIPSFNVAAKGDGRFNHSVFQVPGLISVPCDNEAHHVTVVELKELETKLLWYAVPKMDTRVHLNAKIKNTSEYVLLSGEASVYVDGTFISRSCVPSAGPDESFDCSLGLDSSIKITYHPLSSKVSQRTPFTGFTGLNSISTFGTTKTTATRYTQRVTVLNTKRVRIDALKLLDRLPVSEDERIAVKILKPAELNTSNNHNKPGQTQLTETAGGLDYQNVEDTSSVTSLKNGKKKRFSTSKILPSFGSSSAVPKSVEAMEGEPKKTFEYDGSASVPSTPASAPASTQNSGPDPKLQIVAQWDGTDADKEGPIHEDGHFDQAGGTGVSSAGRQGGEKERSAGLESDGKMNWLLHDIPPQGTVNLVLEWEVSAASNIRVYEREV